VLDTILFGLKILLLILLYLFIWRVAWSAGRDLTLGSRAAAVGVQAPPPVVAGPETRAAAVAGTGAKPGWFDPGESKAPVQFRPRLVVENSPTLAAGAELPLAGRLTVGRAPDSDVVLDDPFVSAAHAKLATQDRSVSVEDLGSTNGTFVNEKQVVEARLRPGERLRIGDTVFRYEE
jgi:Inner membrane component of T3SS, cytoplasmic domain